MKTSTIIFLGWYGGETAVLTWGEVSQIFAASSPRSACWLPHCPWRSSPETAIRPPLGCCCCLSAERPQAPVFPVVSARPAARRCPLILLLCSRLCAVMSSGDRAARCVRGGGGLDAFCLLGFSRTSPTFARRPHKPESGVLITLSPPWKGSFSKKRARTMSYESEPPGPQRVILMFLFFFPFLAASFHSWGCMNGAIWMEAARRHKRAGGETATIPSGYRSRCCRSASRAGEHPLPAEGRVVRFRGADAVWR